MGLGGDKETRSEYVRFHPAVGLATSNRNEILRCDWLSRSQRHVVVVKRREIEMDSHRDRMLPPPAIMVSHAGKNVSAFSP